MSPRPRLSDSFTFGRFAVCISRREFLADGTPVALGGRNFDLLIALVEAAGEVVRKDELMSRVWSRRVVEEGNLHAGISALRKALGPDRDLIRTVAGRGYQLAGTVRESPSPGQADRPLTNLPVQAELVSREDVLARLGLLQSEQRHITLCGAGGIGKTRLAIEAARRALAAFRDGVWLVDLAPLSEAALVPGAVAAVLGLPLSGASAEAIAGATAQKQLLLVLDNCEHLIDAAAQMTDLLAQKCPSVHILCTSREPLKVDQEWVFYVPALEVPREDALSPHEVMSTGAAQLFALRARRANPDFSIKASQAETLGAICRRLDGIPLAIELAAARAAILGVEEIAARLDDRFRLLTGGHRTALPRHQTLRATLDWSRDLLSEPDRRALGRLALFVGPFSLEAATALLAEDADPAAVVGSVTSLAEKSLLTVIRGDTGTHYRMLETTRSYALEGLAERGELDLYARRHAHYLLAVLRRASEDWERLPESAWATRYGVVLDDARAALNWAATRSGDATLAADLAVGLVPLWVQCSLYAELRPQLERALTMILSRPGEADLRREMRLRAALGGMPMRSGPGDDIDRELHRSHEIALQLGDGDYQVGTLLGSAVRHIVSGNLGKALPFAQRHRTLIESRGNAEELAHSDNLMSYLLSWLGDQRGSRHYIDRYNARPPAIPGRLRTIGHHYDKRNTAACRVLWLEGKADQAMATADSHLREVLATGHAMAVGSLLASVMCPLALLRGDWNEAVRCAALLEETAARNAMPSFIACARAFAASVQVARGDFEPATARLRDVIAEFRRINVALYEASLTSMLTEGLRGSGKLDQALAVIDEAIEQSERTQARWFLPEQWRVKGELLLEQQGVAAAGSAQQWFEKALQLAREQGALAWELRTTMSIARLQAACDPAGARHLLRTVVGRFTEGFGTADLIAAAALSERI